VLKRVLIGLLCFVVVAALAGAVVGIVTPSPRVYAVAEVQAGVRQNPRAWVGRTVLVRGWSNSSSGQGCAPFRPTAHQFPSLVASCKRAWLTLTPTFPSPSVPSAATEFPVLLPRTGPDPTHLDLPLSAGMGLHTLPVVGPTVFRWSGSRTLRVRVTMNASLCDNLPPCGVLVP
jgi:hypothetical protein